MEKEIKYITLDEFSKLYPDLVLDQYAVTGNYVKLKVDGTPAKKRGFKKGTVRRYSKVKGVRKADKANRKRS